MKSLGMLLLALATAAGVVAGAQQAPLRFYHSAAGIAQAARIRQYEQALDSTVENRIVGGHTVTADAHPYLGGLLIYLTNRMHSVCGSSLLSATRAITAGHCWWDGRSQAHELTVVYGSNRLYRFINPIPLTSSSSTFVGQLATAAGYGGVGQNIPISLYQERSEVTMPVISNEACAAAYLPGTVISSNLCTSFDGGRGICGGDSGGPLTVGTGNDRVLIGVTSFSTTDGCEFGAPSGFSRISSFRSWIQQKI